MEKDILLVATGLIVGGVNAIAGGGMLIGFPVLIALGMPPLIANATGNVITSPGQMFSAFAYRKHLMRVPLRFLILAIPCLIGAVAGTLTLRFTPSADFSRLAPALIFFGVLLFAVQPFIHFHTKNATKPRGHRRQALLPLILISLILIPLTFYGGYFGPGFGFMMLAMLGFTTLRDTHAMNAIKNLSATLISTISIACLFTAHLIDWRAGLIMAAGTSLGGYIGALGAQKVSSRHLRVVIICFGLAATAFLTWKVY